MGIRRTLDRIAQRFSAQSGVDYGFILQVDDGNDRHSWTVAATASVPWKADGILDYQAALNAIRDRIPSIG